MGHSLLTDKPSQNIYQHKDQLSLASLLGSCLTWVMAGHIVLCRVAVNIMWCHVAGFVVYFP